ncbi:thioesterase family protein [Caballeronia mineralivorans]|jgi:predicted thioesterase|uniref:thioesterase family protein n=1 Tax=Caballeronia mineralivorans TaxID=2010198 RepID=UPI0023F22336|nr:hotdog domain-containing protein [Caballeronia mineralivorans]MDB5788849.1 hypothetical protein [Caballeronia mineralivorans]MEA3101352.1 fluoroacetyl-CoA thioesterase [Caballeronia mineralivorans]
MLETGKTASIAHIVREQDLASAYGDSVGECYPDVLSTPAMLGLMERACAQIMRGELGEGQLSVGVTTHLDHLAPTRLGVEVVATATFRELDGSLFWFDVAATDSGGRVGSGSHARAIVNRSAIEARAEKRLKA